MRFLLLSALLACEAAPLAAQTYALDRCDRDAVAVGYLRASGTVRYTLGKDGRPVAASIQVIGIDSGSAAAFASAAPRELAICRMHKPADETSVVQRIRFDSAAIGLAPATPATGSETPLALEASGTDASGRPEETPRIITCDRPPRTRPSTTTRPDGSPGPGPGGAMNHGMIVTKIIVGTDGKVVADSITLVTSDNPMNSSNLLRAMASCHFTPARIGGVPVATRITATMIVNESGYAVSNLPGVSVLMP